MRREYPEAPIVGVGAVVIDGTKVLLVRRGQEPLKGEWSLPGGALELGETLQQGVVREVLEETGLIVVPGGISRDPGPDRPGRGLGAGSLPLCPDRFCMPRHRRRAWAAPATRKKCDGSSETNCTNGYRLAPVTLAVVEKAFRLG